MVTSSGYWFCRARGVGNTLVGVSIKVLAAPVHAQQHPAVISTMPTNQSGCTASAIADHAHVLYLSHVETEKVLAHGGTQTS
jgi:hypothetical protein